jgi:hypothetical protein
VEEEEEKNNEKERERKGMEKRANWASGSFQLDMTNEK